MNIPKKLKVCLLVLAISLAGCTIGAGGTLDITPACQAGAVSAGFINLWSATWQGICFLAATTVWAVAILVYVVGFALNHQKAIIWAREQMQEAVFAMLITMFVIGFVSFLCTLDLNSLGLGGACLGGATTNFIDAAFCSLSSMYLTLMQGLLLVIALNSAMAAAATFTIGFAPGGVGTVFTPLAVLGEVANSFVPASIVLVTSAVLTMTQMVLVKMSASIFVALFPIGVILRSFGATRGFGGGLIAIALGFLLFYPFLVVLFYGSVGGNMGISDAITQDYSSLSDSFSSAGPSPGDANWFGGILSPLVGFIGKAIMGAIFIPLLMFMILIVSIKGLSAALGEEVDVSNLTRLI
ncbi:hypothetical protein H0N98_00665 [Candidatus Micrarchaeota archaeon]|nr:hypothetical protein [Candidatus Micrarchaeota archaeon]